MSLYRVGMAMSIAVVSGLIAGIAPALSAANMPPVDAMRMNYSILELAVYSSVQISYRLHPK